MVETARTAGRRSATALRALMEDCLRAYADAF